MSVIVNFRGCSGSGKTWLTREVMKRFSMCVPLGDFERPLGYELLTNSNKPTYLVGSYNNVCGGCDTIKTQDEACARVRNYANYGHVLFEGLMISTIFERYRALDRELTAAGHTYIWAFLDTPLDTCLARVQQRRDARGDTRPFNPALTKAKWELMRSIEYKARASKLRTEWVSSDDADRVFGWLQ